MSSQTESSPHNLINNYEVKAITEPSPFNLINNYKVKDVRIPKDTRP